MQRLGMNHGCHGAGVPTFVERGAAFSFSRPLPSSLTLALLTTFFCTPDENFASGRTLLLASRRTTCLPRRPSTTSSSTSPTRSHLVAAQSTSARVVRNKASRQSCFIGYWLAAPAQHRACFFSLRHLLLLTTRPHRGFFAFFARFARLLSLRLRCSHPGSRTSSRTVRVALPRPLCHPPSPISDLEACASLCMHTSR